MTAALQAWLPLPLLCWLPSDLSVTSPSFYGGLRFQGADLCRNKSTLQLRCRRADDRGQSENPNWRRLKTEHGHIILFTSKHLSPRGPRWYVYVCACAAAQQCKHCNGPGRRWETRQENRGDTELSCALALSLHAVWLLLYGMWLY